MSISYPFSIGGWCLVSGGSGPFVDSTREIPLEMGLEPLAAGAAQQILIVSPLLPYFHPSPCPLMPASTCSRLDVIR